MTSGTWPDGTWNKADEHCRAKAWAMVVGLMSEVMTGSHIWESIIKYNAKPIFM